MGFMNRRRKNHNPERAEAALERLSDRDDRVGRLCRMMLNEDGYESLEDSGR